MQEYRRNGHFQNCNFGGLLRIRKKKSELRFRNGFFFQNYDFGGWATKNMKGTISSFGMVIGYRGLSKLTRVNSSRVKYQFRLRFDLTCNSTSCNWKIIDLKSIQLDSTRELTQVDSTHPELYEMHPVCIYFYPLVCINKNLLGNISTGAPGRTPPTTKICDR
ncbi:unnamed protein product [Rhizophagus irregularis]|nr:unnamed protein product [Rhizophagus irregularis]